MFYSITTFTNGLKRDLPFEKTFDILCPPYIRILSAFFGPKSKVNTTLSKCISTFTLGSLLHGKLF